MSSPVCHPDAWTDLDTDALVRLYDVETTAILDRLVRRRPSDPWFDQECRLTKRRVRQLERVARAADVHSSAVAEWTAAHRAYRALLRRKREAFWTSKVESERSSPRQLWRSIDALMGRGRVPPSEVIGAAEFHRYFEAKVADVRALTDSAPPPSFFSALSGCTFVNLRSLTVYDVTAAIQLLPDKQCASDPIPTRLLNDYADVVAPFLVELYNKSLQTGSVPASCKAADITPLLKKSDLDSADVRSCRPISNLSVLSRLLERLVARQLLDHLAAAKLLPELQSAYRAHHSTETAVLKVSADILSALDTGDVAVLTLLDLSAAFDTVDHATSLRRLKTSYGIGGSVPE